MNAVYEKNEGIMNASSLGMLPQNHEQVAYLRRGSGTSGTSICSNKSACDPLFMVMEQSENCESGYKFVRVVTASPEPMCIQWRSQRGGFGAPPPCQLLLIVIQTYLGLSILSSPVYHDQIKFITHALALAMQMGVVNVTVHALQAG